MPPLALPPLVDQTLAGTLSGRALEKVAREGARTVPARENGGNHDIKNFTRGSRVYYPVHVAGANLSGGDLHFSQGDGEITFCGAIEMGGFIDFGVDLIKDGMNKYGVTTNPIFIPGRVEPRYSDFLTFIGISVDEGGENHYLDATIAYRRACLNAIEYLKKFGYTGEQAYLLLGSAPIEGRISGVVDIPNACCSLYLPTAIFDIDIRPTADGPTPRGPRRGGEHELMPLYDFVCAGCGPFEQWRPATRAGRRTARPAPRPAQRVLHRAGAAPDGRAAAPGARARGEERATCPRW